MLGYSLCQTEWLSVACTIRLSKSTPQLAHHTVSVTGLWAGVAGRAPVSTLLTSRPSRAKGARNRHRTRVDVLMISSLSIVARVAPIRRVNLKADSYQTPFPSVSSVESCPVSLLVSLCTSFDI